MAVVSVVNRNLGQPFADIKASPEAHLERSREVLLVLKQQNSKLKTAKKAVQQSSMQTKETN